MVHERELDAIGLAESLPGFAGAWRLSPPPFALAPGEVAYELAIAVRGDDLSSAYIAGAFAGQGGRVLVFDPANGPPSPLRRALPLTLSPFERARARERAAVRQKEQWRLLEGMWDPVPDPFPSPKLAPVATIHSARAPCAPSRGRCASVATSLRARARTTPPSRVLVVDREGLVAAPLRGLSRGSAKLLRVASRWEALERLEYQPFDRVVVVEDVPQRDDEPSLFRFYRAAATLWPWLAERFLFVVDEKARALIVARRPELAARVLERDPSAIARALEPVVAASVIRNDCALGESAR